VRSSEVPLAMRFALVWESEFPVSGRRAGIA